MADPNYQPVSKSKFDLLKENFKTDSKDYLVVSMRLLFDNPKGVTVNLKKDDTLALADRLEAEGFDWAENVYSRSGYAEMLESLKE